VPLRAAALDRSHRAELRELLAATNAFGDDEIAVALELFDEAHPPAGGVGAPSASPDYEFVAALNEQDSLKGYACWGPTPGTDRTYDLYWIAVDPGAQGAGGGTLLLAEVERRLADRRARMVVVETSSRPEYAGARGFYARRGYEEAARVREFYASGDDRIILTKRIEQRGS
jgi:ribosomal protein S18 acetylase RimI-like enzyme